MTSERLAAVLAEKVMNWHVGPDRFMMGGRRWLPRWRFQPAGRLEDAFRLLEHAAPQEYAMGAAENGGFWARVRVAGTTGEAQESSQARAITLAVARAIGVEV
jgi:ABA sandwich protein